MSQRFKTIVLVDDNEDDNFIHERFLAAAKWSIDVRSYNDGYQFLEELVGIQPPPDVIFLDLNMPVLNGFEVLAEIERLEAATDAFIVILTSSIHPADRSRAETSDRVTAYVEKPLNLVTLEALAPRLVAS